MSSQRLSVVTGAAGALGSAVARQLAADGHRVVMMDVAADRLEEEARELGAAASPLVVDVGDPAAVEGACETIRNEHGTVDTLVNNAGLLSNNKAEGTSVDEWRRLMAVNLDGAFYLTRTLLPGMRAQRWGRVVNVCSLAMKSGGLTAGTAYTASKGGLGALTFSLAREVAAEGITVNGVAPAYIRTPMVTEQLTSVQREALLRQIPVGRFCEPEEVARLIAFLVSPHAGFITGEIIDINGGLHMD
ncbi:MAG: SDR family NAD(P)-dependent oxidoreductase [Deltaproteobacteria bacterium]|nr:SDR family NAD(P)-dependent oxidoreductase [Deltaproteobacteria bacterium]